MSCCTDMQGSGVLARTALVYGQMNEPPGARWRVPMTALTIAEYFRDSKHQNVLLLMDNVFRFVQAGSEVSGLLGRLPSRVGYQPTLASEVAALQERIASVGGRLRHRDPGGLCARRRFHRSGGHRDLDPYRQLHRAVARSWRRRASIRRSTRCRRPRCCSTRSSSATITTGSPSGRARRWPASRNCRTSSRCWASRNSAPATG